jgi:DNA-binding Xre family transcriptional regulator
MRAAKPVSTLEKWGKSKAFNKALDKEYTEVLLSELIISIMAEQKKSIRDLAAEIGLSKTIIQNLRSGLQADIKLGNFLKLLHAYGYSLVLEGAGKKKIRI